MVRWFPKILSIPDTVVKFECFYCDYGKIRLSTEEYDAATEGRKRKKCPHCDEWLSFQIIDGDVHDIKGRDELE